MDATQDNNGCLSAADSLGVAGGAGVSADDTLAHTRSSVSGFPVEKLDDTTFFHRLHPDFSLVKFYVPQCGWCQRLAPTWALLGSAFDKTKNVQIAEVDCMENRSLCRRYQIDGYPTIYLFKNGRPVEEFNGDRSIQSLSEYVKKETSKETSQE